MAYSIIQPPFTLKFQEMTKSELRNYYSWFMSIMPERIAGLEAYVREVLPIWRADKSPESLGPLGEWFATRVETRQKSNEEIEEIRANLRFPVEVSTEQLTNKTFSIAMDVGMYFGQVVLCNLSGTRWDQCFGSKKAADYGEPVLMGFGPVPLNPVRIAVVIARKVSHNKHNANELLDVYCVWAKKIKN